MFSDREFNSDVGFKGVWHRGLRAVLRLHAFNLLSHQYCEVPGIVGFKEDWKRPGGQGPELECVSAYDTLISQNPGQVNK